MADDGFAGRAGVITGAASGIGEAAARLFIRRGGRALLVDRDLVRLEQVVASLGAAAVAWVGDVGATDTAQHYTAAALRNFGRIDVALLNAGISGRVGRLQDGSADEFDEIMRVNVRSVWSGLAALIPVMKEAGGGSIVVTASTGGVLGAPMVAPYIASKHAVVGLVKSAAIEVARHNIRVNAVAPAPIDTPMMSAIGDGLGQGDTEKARARTVANVPLRRYGTAQEVAQLMLFLASDAAGYCTGGVHLIDGGMAAGIS